MKRIQLWFEQIAGISQGEIERLALAKQIFGARNIDMAVLNTPACWRRKARVRQFAQ